MRLITSGSTTAPAPGATVAILVAALAGCAGSTTSGTPAEPPGSADATPSSTSHGATHSTTAAPTTSDEIVGTVVRFSSGRTSVDVTIGEDSPATRDLLSMLPLELELEDLAGREKIAYLPRELTHDGTAGSDPEDGDLIYFTPWGNLGFYYDASGIGYSDATLHLGTYQATPDRLALLEGEQVTVAVVP